MFQSASWKIMPYVVGLVVPSQGSPGELGIGTGTIINRRGLILTADHVLEGTSGDVVVSRNFIGRVPECFNLRYQSVARFPAHDLALIYIPNLPLDDVNQPMEWLFSDLRYGCPVGSFGHPAPQVERSTVHHSQTLIDITLILRFKSYFIAGFSPNPPSTSYTLDSFAYGGHSGGPVFDEEGRIFSVMVRANLDQTRGHVISFCEAAALSNIRSELVDAQRRVP